MSSSRMRPAISGRVRTSLDLASTSTWISLIIPARRASSLSVFTRQVALEDTPISAKVRPTSIPARWLRRPSRMHRKPFSLQAASRVAKSSSFRTGAATIRCTRVGTPLGPLGPFSTSSSAISSHGALFSHTSTTYCSAAAMLGSSCTTALTAVALAVKS